MPVLEELLPTYSDMFSSVDWDDVERDDDRDEPSIAEAFAVLEPVLET